MVESRRRNNSLYCPLCDCSIRGHMPEHKNTNKHQNNLGSKPGQLDWKKYIKKKKQRKLPWISVFESPLDKVSVAKTKHIPSSNLTWNPKISRKKRERLFGIPSFSRFLGMGPMSTTVDPKLSNKNHPVSAPYGCRGLTWFHLQMKDRQRTPGSFGAPRFYLLEMDQGGCEVWKTETQPQISRKLERMVFLKIFFLIRSKNFHIF